MINPFAAFYNWLRGLFFSKEVEIIIGKWTAVQAMREERLVYTV